jgi:WD40 repeat protein
MILHADHAGERERHRFQAEAEAVARLQHPNIVQIYEVGEHRGLPYFSLEFCPGGSLGDKLNGTPLPAQEAARLVETLSQAMQAAHQAHVIHRDLKPANMLLTADGTPKITDFGLAKKLDVQGQTHTGAVMGTPSYMAPEQAGGQKDISPAADVYALGAILYEMLTGRPPFKGASTWDTVQMVIGTEPVAPRQLQPKVPRDLETICLKCLQKQPSRRYTSAATLADDLRRFRAGEPILARPVGPLERGWRWCLRNPMAAGLSAAVVLLLIAVAVGSTVGAIYLNLTTNEARRNAEQARYNQYVAEINLVQRDYEANNIGQVRELLDAQVPRDRDATDFRNFEWYYWDRMAHRELLTLKGHTRPVLGVSFSPDSRRLVSASYDETIRIWDAATGKELQLLTFKGHKGMVHAVSFSADGRRLASASQDQTVRVWDVATGQELLNLKGHTGNVSGVAFSPDGQRLASAGVDQTVRVWDAATGKELLTLKGHKRAVYRLAFSPDGRRLASASNYPELEWPDNEVRVWDAATGEELFTLEKRTGTVNDVAFSPDGNRLAVARTDSTVDVYWVRHKRGSLTLKGHTGQVYGVSFSTDSRRLASASWDQTVRVWDPDTGEGLFTLKGHTNSVFSLSFSPDGRRLASAGSDQTVRIWDAVTGQESLALKSDRGVTGMSLSQDGGRLASASWDKTVRVWDAASGQELLTLKGHTGQVYGVSFSPDGGRLASAGEDKIVRVWDIATKTEMLSFRGHTDLINRVCFSPDGRRLASASQDQTVRVWDANTGKELLTLKGNLDVCFSPDGSRLASSAGDIVRVWEAATGQELLSLEGHTSLIQGLSFSPDSCRLASAGEDHTVRVWDAATGKELLTLKGHTDRVNSVCFSPDGRRLASASWDHTVRVWDAATGKELLTLKGHTSQVNGVSFSPDGWRIASVGSDGTVRVWEGLAMPDTVWRQRGWVSQVNSLFEELLLREEVLTALRKDITLNEADRKFALNVAQVHPENPQALSVRAWNTVAHPLLLSDYGTHISRKGFYHQAMDKYTRALSIAEAAVRLAPEDGSILKTLGIAQYRVGCYADALATLTKSEKLNTTTEGSHPEDLAFLAMTQHQLGKKNEAKATLGRLRDARKKPRWAEDNWWTGFLREAEELIEGKAGDKVDRNTKPASQK